jgi:hypothetical protein
VRLAEEHAEQPEREPHGDGRAVHREIAIRNSRHPDGPAPVYTREEIETFIKGAKDGDFDDLITPVLTTVRRVAR